MKDDFKKFVLSLYKPVKFLTFVMIISMIISQMMDLAKQSIIKGIVDLPTLPNFEITTLYKVMIALVVVIVLEIIFFYISNITRTIYVVKKQTPYIAEKLFKHLDKKTYPFFVDNYSGKISTSINEVNEEITNLNTRITAEFIARLTSMVSSLILLYTINFNIFITATILFVGIIVSRLVYFSKRYLPLVQKAQEYNREYNGILNDAVLNFSSLKIYNAIEKFSKTLKLKKKEANLYKNKASTREFSYGAIANVAYIVVLIVLMVYAIKLLEQNIITLGSFVVFINAMISIKSQSTKFTWSYIHIGEILVKLKNSYELLYVDNNVKEDTKENLIIESGKVEFKDVSFRYNTNYVFENLNLIINDRKKVGIIGVSRKWENNTC